MRNTTILTAALAFGSGLLVAPGISGPTQQEADWHELVLGIAHLLLLTPIDGAPGCWIFLFEQRGGIERP